MTGMAAAMASALAWPVAWLSVESVASASSEGGLSAGFDSSPLATVDCVTSFFEPASTGWSAPDGPAAAASPASASVRPGLSALAARGLAPRDLSDAAASSRREWAGRLSACWGGGAASFALAAAVVLLSTSEAKLSLAGVWSARVRGGGAWKVGLAEKSDGTLTTGGLLE